MQTFTFFSDIPKIFQLHFTSSIYPVLQFINFDATKPSAMKSLLTLALLAVVIHLPAAPFFGKIMRFPQPDGTSVDVKLYGDEYYMRAEGLDNYTLIRDKTTDWICYAVLATDGSELISSGIVYRGKTGIASSLKSNLNIPHHIDISDKSREKLIFNHKRLLNRSLDPETWLNTASSPVIGNIKGLCIVIDFSDAQRTVPLTEISDFCNKMDYSNYGNNGSLRKYYSDVSGGLVDYQNVVYGYYRAPLTFAEYDKMTQDQALSQILGWVLNQLNSEGFDFSTLSTHPDGSIVAINIMYTGTPKTWGKGLWYHQGHYPDFAADGVRSGLYNCSPANAPLILATVAHENGHMIAGWPDTYKYSTTNGPDGIGTFDLMCYYGNDHNPVPPNPLFRTDAGWGKVVDITNYNGIINDAANSLTCYKYQINNNDEYFLIESRRKKGRSTFIPDEGLTIWHINRAGDNQSINHLVFLEHANNNVNNHADACFHAGFNNEFSSNTLPGSGLYNGDPSGLRIRNISAVSDTMTYLAGVATPSPSLYVSFQNIANDNNANGMLEPGETGRISLKAGNNGSLSSGNTSIACTAIGNTASYVTINTPSVNTGIISVNQSVTANPEVTIHPGTPTGTMVDLRFTLSDGIYSTFLTKTFIIGRQIIMKNLQASACSAMFYDDGGAFSNYDEMTDYTTTFSPPVPSLRVKAEFLSFELEDDANCVYDYLKIYNGGSTSSPLIGTFCGTNSPGTITSTNPDGKLTFQFHSDVAWRFAGWSARISVDPLLAAAGTITGNPSVCQGQNAVTYTVPPVANATSYLWTLPSGATGTSTTNSITVNYGASAVSGNMSVKGYNSCGEGKPSSLQITVKNSPATPVITQNSSTLHSNVVNGNQWYNQAGAVTGEMGQDIIPKISGGYFVKVSADGCTSESSNVIQYYLLDIQSPELNQRVNVYPNPVGGELVVEFRDNAEKKYFEMINSTGQVVHNGFLFEKAILQTASFPPGLYLLIIQSGKVPEFRKIVKR